MKVFLLYALCSIILVNLAAYSNPKIAWCLTNETYATDIVSGSSQDNRQCGFNFDNNGHHPSGFLGTTLDREHYPYIDLNVPNNLQIDADFAFAISFKPRPPYTGCVFHYQSNASAGTNIYAVKACINDTTFYGAISVVGYPDDEITIAGSITKDAWNILIFGIDVSAAKYDVYLDSLRYNQVYVTLYAVRPRNLVFPGYLRVGSKLNGSLEDRFSGSVVVVAMFDYRAKSSEEGDILNECLFPDNFAYQPNGLPSIPSSGCLGLPTLNETHGMFVKVKQNATPNPSQHSPIATYHVTSAIKCGSECLLFHQCYSFSVEVSMALKFKTCKLFSGIFSSLLPQSGITYYKLI